MPVDEKSSYLHMPLPHEANRLDQDVTRLRAAFDNLDSHAQSSDAAQAALKSELANKSRELAARDDMLRETLESASACLTAHLAAENPHHIPAASADAPGLVRPDNVTCTVSEAGVLRGSSMLCNTREVLTESGSYTAPVSGWYRVTCVGGGGAGGKSVFSTHTSTQSIGKGGAQGGTTSFAGMEAPGGGGGAGSTSLDGAGGGAAGSIVTACLYLSAGQAVAAVIGAGAPETQEYTAATVDNSYVFGAGPGGGRFLYHSTGGGGAAGAGNGCTGWNNNGSGSYIVSGTGGAGGTNGSGYGGGGGGGGGCGYGNIKSYPATGGAASDGGRYGTPGSLSDYTGGNGGAGGNGAVILEYYNPDAPTA